MELEQMATLQRPEVLVMFAEASLSPLSIHTQKAREAKEDSVSRKGTGPPSSQYRGSGWHLTNQMLFEAHFEW